MDRRRTDAGGNGGDGGNGFNKEKRSNGGEQRRALFKFLLEDLSVRLRYSVSPVKTVPSVPSVAVSNQGQRCKARIRFHAWGRGERGAYGVIATFSHGFAAPGSVTVTLVTAAGTRNFAQTLRVLPAARLTPLLARAGSCFAATGVCVFCS